MVRGGFHIHRLLRKRIGQLVENSVMEIIDGHTVEVKYDLSLRPQSRTQRRTSHPSHSPLSPLAQTVVNISLGHRWEEPNPSVISWRHRQRPPSKEEERVETKPTAYCWRHECHLLLDLEGGVLEHACPVLLVTGLWKYKRFSQSIVMSKWRGIESPRKYDSGDVPESGSSGGSYVSSSSKRYGFASSDGRH
jgi:hypothetical protein